MSLLAVGRVYRIACAAAAEVHDMCPRCRRGAAGVMAAWRQMRNAAPGGRWPPGSRAGRYRLAGQRRGCAAGGRRPRRPRAGRVVHRAPAGRPRPVTRRHRPATLGQPDGQLTEGDRRLSPGSPRRHRRRRGTRQLTGTAGLAPLSKPVRAQPRCGHCGARMEVEPSCPAVSSIGSPHGRHRAFTGGRSDESQRPRAAWATR